MKILILHTKYQIQGGEDAVFMQESALLATHHQVENITFQNQAGWRGAIQYILSIWNIAAGRKLKKAIKEFQPDVIHIHNIHFGIGPIAIRIAKKLNIPVVLTVHNYRLLCPSAILQVNGELFTNSLSENFPWTAIKKKVYRNSWFQTFWLALVNWLHREIGTWKMVDRYIVLTAFSKNLFLNSTLGIDDQQLVVKPNYVDSIKAPIGKKESHFLFIGRLMEEKGIVLLLDTFKKSNLQLVIGGSGPMEKLVIETCENYSNITYLGNLNKTQVQDAMHRCSALIFPSTWYEGMPMTIIEAFASGTPVIASNLGAMQSMIDDGYNGLLFETGHVDSLLSQITKWHHFTEEQQRTFRNNALTQYKNNYTPTISLDQLTNLYESINRKKGTTRV